MNPATYDVIVIGAGPAGETVAGALADDGRSVAIVEDRLVGGDCAFYACMPSKALLRPGDALREVRRVPGAAQAISGPLDVAAVLERRDEVIHSLDDAPNLPWLRERGITLLRGRGRLHGERAVAVDGVRHVAREAVVIATGSRAAVPEITGLAESAPWTGRQVTIARALPDSLIVLGGGAVGVEMAQAYCDLGVRVTLIETEDRLLAGEEPFAGEQVAAALGERGVELHLGVQARSVRRSGATVSVELGGAGVVEAQEMLVAAGRRPATDDLGVETVGLDPGTVVEVDDTMRVRGHRWLYAVGDVNGRSLLTHTGKYQARVAAAVIAGRDARATADRGAPRAIFTDPQVAAVGATLAQARETRLRAYAYDTPSSGTAGSSFHGRGTPGTARIVVDEDRGVLIGATFTGTEVVEWLHAATIALVGEIPVDRLWEAVPVFPSRSEIWLRLLEERGRARRGGD